MSREYNIKWRENDRERLRKAVKNYNAKISRIEKKYEANEESGQFEKNAEIGIEKHLLPRRASAASLTESIKTRREFNRAVARLESFSKRGGEYKMDWKKAEEKRLSAAVKAFNEKVEQLSAGMSEREKAALPEPANYKQLKKIIGTRQDLKREVKALQRFLKSGAEEIVIMPGTNNNLKLTKWQLEEMERRLPGVNEAREMVRKKIADIDMTDRGKKTGYTRGNVGMGKAEEHALSPVNISTPEMNRPDLTRKFRQIMRESQSDYWDRRDEILRKNYIQGIEQNFPRGADDIIDIIENMDFKEFRKVFEAEGGNFDPLYPPRGEEEYQEYLSALRAIWDPKK